MNAAIMVHAILCPRYILQYGVPQRSLSALYSDLECYQSREVVDASGVA
jgi:hypothetical protein